MKLVLAVLFASVMSSAMAYDDCVYYPVRDGKKEAYKGTVSQVSGDVYGKCADSILINDRIVARLSQIVKDGEVKRCLFSTKVGLLVMCGAY